MPRTQHLVFLSPDERRRLSLLISRGVAPASDLAHARVLLKADRSQGGRRVTDRQIADAVEMSPRHIARIRARFCVEGIDRALRRRRARRVYTRKLDGVQEAALVELACTTPPAGKDHWSVRMLSDRLVQLQVVDAIGPTTVWTVLKKTNSNRG